MVGRLDQHIARVVEGEQPARAEPGNKIRHHVDVGSGDQAQRNALSVEACCSRVACRICGPVL